MDSKIHIIAEAGTNHNGNPETAKQLADASKRASADSVKYQIIYPEGLYLPKIFHRGQYTKNEVFEKRQAWMLTGDEYRALAAYCVRIAIPFSGSVFDERGLDLLEELKASYIKIASGDLNNGPFLQKAAERGKKIIISTGMSTLKEIEESVSIISKTGNDDIVLMHCVSVYPSRAEMMNLSFIQTLRRTFGYPVGLSDHTNNSISAIITASIGVDFIEKHITLDHTAEGFDHSYATEPDQFAKYVEDIRLARQASTPAPQKISEEEAAIRQRARRSLYASRDIQAGEVIQEIDILIVRPEGPLVPNQLHEIVGRKSSRPIHQYEAITLDMFK